jgi:DNA repair protein RecO (recombination protein O)
VKPGVAVYHADAIIIRSQEYGESDRLLSLFSREKGRIQAIAKGVRKPKSRQRGGTQLFTYADFLLYRGRSLDVVNQASPRESFPHLWNDLEGNVAAAGIAELLDIALLSGQPQPELFSLTLTCFFLLAHDEPLLVLAAFTLRLLSILGYSPVWGECVECGAKVEGERLCFCFQAGGVLCPTCAEGCSSRRLTAGSIAFIRHLERADLTKLDRLRWSSRMRQEIADVLQSYCEYKLERPLRSWKIRKDLKI